ncbi:putative ABC3 transporter permease protein domain-containing protein [Candidatus Magnetomoraceae bacterium gMMP-1]
MNAWWNIALTEWRGSLFSKRIPGCSGQRDFRSLIFVLILIFIFAFLLIGCRAGLLDRLIDVFLGRLPGSGVPVWFTTETVQGEAIKREDINRISKVNISNQFKIHPYREVNSYDISIPGYHDSEQLVWTDNKSKKNSEIKAWAVYPWDPLWKISIKSLKSEPERKNPPGLPLEVVLDKKMFEKCFNCQTYLKKVKENVPYELCKNIPNSKMKKDNLSCLDNQILWLKVNTGWKYKNNEYLPFKIHWADDKIPALEKLAFLFPLSTYHALIISHQAPKMYFPEAEGKAFDRLKLVSIYDPKNKISKETKEQVIKCLNSPEIEDYKDKQLMSFKKHPLPENWLKACLLQYDIPLKGEKMMKPPYVSVDEVQKGYALNYDFDGYLNMDTLPSVFTGHAEKGNSKKAEQKLDAVKLTNGYNNLMIYIMPEQIGLKPAVEKLMQIKKKNLSGKEDISMFCLHPIYEDALARFSFFNDIVNTLKVPFMIIFTIFVIFILFIQLGIIIIHREHNYGILLSKGYSSRDIYLILGSQFLLTAALGIVIAIPIIQVIRFYLNNKIFVLLPKYIEYLNIFDSANLNLLSISWFHYCSIFFASLFIGLIIIIELLWFNMKLKPNKDPEPSLLLHN